MVGVSYWRSSLRSASGTAWMFGMARLEKMAMVIGNRSKPRGEALRTPRVEPAGFARPHPAAWGARSSTRPGANDSLRGRPAESKRKSHGQQGEPVLRALLPARGRRHLRLRAADPRLRPAD